MSAGGVLRRLTQQLDQAQRQFVQQGDAWLAQPEALQPLHDLRVAWRRLRAILDVLRRESELKPAAAAVKESMAPLMRSSSAVRDLDVLMPQLQQWSDESPELLSLGQMMATQRAERAAWFGAHWRQQQLLMAAAMDVLRQQLQSVSLSKDLYDEALARCEKRARRAAQPCADTTDARAWHQLRVRCKQWRYALELADAADGKRGKRLRALQRHLGNAQDAAAAIALLSQLACSVLPPACLLAMGRQQCRLEQQRLQALQQAQRKLSRLLNV